MRKVKKQFSLERMWAYLTIQDLLKRSETEEDNQLIKEQALNQSLRVIIEIKKKNA